MPSVEKIVQFGSMPEPDRLRRALADFESVTREPVPARRRLEVISKGATWTYEESNAFFEHLAEQPEKFYCHVDAGPDYLTVSWTQEETLHIQLCLPNQADLKGLLHLLAKEESQPNKSRPAVFIGHGRGAEWRRLRAFLSNDLGLETLVYEGDIRLGRYPTEVLWELQRRADLAILIHTPDWMDEGGALRPGENVVHETGLFQAWLGRERAILVRHELCTDFANVRGLEALTFRDGRIEDVFGDLRRALTRYFDLA
jgi:hypothetical protein